MNRRAENKFWRETIGRLPLQEPQIVTLGTSVEKAIYQMQKMKTGCILVVDSDGVLKGVFTERDVMRHFVGTDLSGETPVEEVMTWNPITISPETTVAQAIDFFGEQKFRHLPVCRGPDDIAGLLSVRVMVQFMAENLPSEVLNLPPEEGIVSKETAGG